MGTNSGTGFQDNLFADDIIILSKLKDSKVTSQGFSGERNLVIKKIKVLFQFFLEIQPRIYYALEACYFSPEGG